MAKVLQFRVILVGTNPLIWRRFKVTDDYRLDRFHQVVQLTMDWYNAHLDEFMINDKRVGMLFDDGFDMEQPMDENTTYLKDFSLKVGKQVLTTCL